MGCENCDKCNECGSDLKKKEVKVHEYTPQQYVVRDEGSGFWKWAGGFLLGWLFFG